MKKNLAEGLFAFLKDSPTAYQTVETVKKTLDAEGFAELHEYEKWDVKEGGKYYVTRNGSSIIAFKLGKDLSDYNFQVVASHSDSPAFKVKENAELMVRSKYMQLNTEGYGSMIYQTWLDRPLSLAGRVLIRENGSIVTKSLHIKRDLLLIPNVAIHMNRSANDGMVLNKQIDLMPLFGGPDCKDGDFRKFLAKEIGCEPDDILSTDIFLYNRQEPTVWGANEEYISAGHLDDLQCAYASLCGFIEAGNDKSIDIYCCFDNEEVGSQTKQGAKSTFFFDVLRRINFALGKSYEEYLRAVPHSFMLSADNAHAVHPNHPEKTDAKNCVFMNEGIVVKYHAGQKYTSDGLSSAVFQQICENAGVPVQFFANRSDMGGGSTLGNLIQTQVSMCAVDIGLPQLAMHSSYETAGLKDTQYLIDACKEFYNSRIYIENGKIDIVK